jgi:hypothetical protein
MKSRFNPVFLSSSLFAGLILLTTLLTGCDFTLPWEPTLPAPAPTVAPTPALWDYSHVNPADCEGKPLYAWSLPGTYTYYLYDKLYSGTILQPNTEPYHNPPEFCPWYELGFGGWLTGPPKSGASMEWTISCDYNQNSSIPHTFTQNSVITVTGWEQITTKLGTFQALRVDTISTNTDSRFAGNGILTTSDWYVCAYGWVLGEATDTWSALNGTVPGSFELLSYTPLTTDESRVRYILADIQLGGVDGYYREHVDAEEVAEALRRWDAGITVTNIDQFERKLVGDTWQVVYAGTETLIDGKDVLLTTDSQP